MMHHNNKTRFVPVIPNIFIEYEPHISCKSIKCQVIGILLLRDLKIYTPGVLCMFNRF